MTSTESDPEPSVATCHIHPRVKIQRLSGGRWITLENSQANYSGRLRLEIEDRPGRYRALVPKSDGCTAATSNTETHRH